MYEQYRPQRFSFLPEVVKNLLIINGIFFLATIVLEQRGIDLIDLIGLHYFEAEKFRWWQFFTYMFMHANFVHILFNMFALWMFGTAIENMWGGRKFLNYYIFCGLGAAVTHYLIVYLSLNPGLSAMDNYIQHPGVAEFKAMFGNPDITKYLTGDEIKGFINNFNSYSSIDVQRALDYSVSEFSSLRTAIANAPNVVGASGAVFGILLAFGIYFPNTQLFFIPFPFPIKAKYAVIIFAVIELIQGTGVATLPGDNAAHFAHLGGLVFGLILILFWRNQNKRKRNDFFNP